MRQTIIGLDLDREFSQISFYSERTSQPETVSLIQNQDRFLIPTPEGLFSTIEDAMDLGIMTLANFLKTCISYLRPVPMMEQVCLVVTMKEVTAVWVAAVRNACEMLGMNRERVFLQTHRESFFYYILNQKKELWLNQAALFEYEDTRISSYIMEIDYGTRPALVTVTPGEILEMNGRGMRTEEEWNEKRDEMFLGLIQRTFQGGSFSSIFLIGDSFDKTWASRSLNYLCRKRHVFQGRNLYTKGACYGACSHAGVGKRLERFLYHSEDMVDTNISMRMEIRGKVSDYLMINAGLNWFDASHVCEFIAEETDEILIFAKSMLGGETVSYTIPLKGLPERPGRTTRLQMKAEFISARECKVTIRDLGFGEFYPASGQAWESILEI